MGDTGSMKNVFEIMDIIDNKNTQIPLLQRNYKWSMECASELAEDLWESRTKDKGKQYQLNMITIYYNAKNDSLQILDGQQRLITLKLFLAFLDKNSINLNYVFERDLTIDTKKSRKHFIEYYLMHDSFSLKGFEHSVDIKRLRDNFISMIIPVSFRSIFIFYQECLDEAIRESTTAEDIFVKGLMRNVINLRLKCLIESNVLDKVVTYFNINNAECSEIYKMCEGFQKLFSTVDPDDDVSDDEIKISEYSYKFQKIWCTKIEKLINEFGIDNIISANKRAELTQFIKEKVEMLYHYKETQPIDEFLNINENKTRFVISDYIRANMISDNPVDGDICKETKDKNHLNRTETLEVFSSLANYLYNEKYEKLWELVKTRYDDFNKHPDINRLKILFCDKYAGTSTKGYSYELEISRLKYFNIILRSLVKELGIEPIISDNLKWNTYNAVYMLLECKEKYRFFNIFTRQDVDNCIGLKDVAARERFCFFEWAYEISKSSEDFWDISYFLESQLDVDRCNKKKAVRLPKNIDENWCCVDRGAENGELHKCIQQIINSIKERGSDE